MWTFRVEADNPLCRLGFVNLKAGAMTELLQLVFAVLREIILRSGRGMTLAHDEPGNAILKTSSPEPGKKDAALFGAVQIKKNYVSDHLMPLYASPALTAKCAGAYVKPISAEPHSR